MIVVKSSLRSVFRQRSSVHLPFRFVSSGLGGLQAVNTGLYVKLPPSRNDFTGRLQLTDADHRLCLVQRWRLSPV